MNARKNYEIARAKQKLAAGILIQARRDLRRFHRATKADAREFYRDAYSWVISDNCSWRFSFRNVCELLKLAPEEIRHELLHDTSLGAFHYCSRRFGCALRQFHISLRQALQAGATPAWLSPQR